MDILQQRDKRLQDVRSQHTSFLIEDILFRPKPTLPQVRYKRMKLTSWCYQRNKTGYSIRVFSVK
jgi:hypothetical protein